MALAQQFCPPVHFLEQMNSGKRYFHFEDKDKLILSVFWQLVNKIEKEESICVVLENQKDAEHLNYLISKYALADLCIILSGSTPEINSHSLGKIKDAVKKQLEPLTNDDQGILSDYNHILNSLEKNLSVLRTEQINNKTALELIDKLNSISGKEDSEKIVSPLISASIFNYAGQKEIVLKAEHLYQNSFSFLDTDFPFTKKICEQFAHVQLIEILTNHLDELEQILSKYEIVETQLFQLIKEEYSLSNQRAKQEINIIDSLLESNDHQHLDTINQKLNHHFKRLLNVAKSGIASTAVFNEDDYNELKHLVHESKDHHHLSLNSDYNKQLESIHKHPQIGNQITELLDKSDAWINALKNADIFKVFNHGMSATFSYEKKLLLKIGKQIKAALHFLDNNENLYAWNIFLSSLNDEDIAIINYLAQRSNNWRLDYDRLFVQHLIDRIKFQLDSPTYQLSLLQENLEDYLTLSLALKKSEIIDASGFDQLEELDWNNLISHHSVELSKRFPIMVIGLNVYASNKEPIQKTYSSTVFLNTLSDSLEDFDKETNQFLFSDEKMIASVQKRLKIPSKRITRIPGPSANINRPLNQLNRSELNRSSMHLANELGQLETEHRIFQLKNVSILSYWSDIKNTKLIASLNQKGIKEIISDNDPNKLLPAIFSNLEHRVYVLIEDGLIVNNDKNEILRQLFLLNQFKHAGISIINIDNLNNQSTVDKAIKKIEFTTQSNDLVVETN